MKPGDTNINMQHTAERQAASRGFVYAAKKADM